MKERLSAAMDGEVELGGSGNLLSRIHGDSELRERWQTYCLIGDALRGDGSKEGDFVGRVMAALDGEPTALAPRVATARPGRARWADRVLPIAASLMGVAAVGWMATAFQAESAGDGRAVQPVASLGQAAAQVDRVPVTNQSMDPHREYVFIHQASSRSSPIPGIAQYVRSVSEVPADANR